MFEKYVVSEVTVGDINEISLELAIKKLSGTNNKFQIVEKKDKVYLVVDGANPIELSGDTFKELIAHELTNKSLETITKNNSLVQLITSLNVIETITLVKPQVSLSDLIKG